MQSGSSASNEDLIGLGAYSPLEAASRRIDRGKIRRWMYGSSKAEPVFDPELGRARDERVVTFLDFAQALHVNQIRLAIGIPLQKIRKAYLQARDHEIRH